MGQPGASNTLAELLQHCRALFELWGLDGLLLRGRARRFWLLSPDYVLVNDSPAFRGNTEEQSNLAPPPWTFCAGSVVTLCGFYSSSNETRSPSAFPPNR